jgi:hypothetical protein
MESEPLFPRPLNPPEAGIRSDNHDKLPFKIYEREAISASKREKIFCSGRKELWPKTPVTDKILK